MITNSFKYIFIISILMAFWACPNVEPDDIKHKNFKKETGFFIVNEGIFQQANASVSFYDRKNDSLYEHIFKNANNEVPGDILQSIYFYNEKGYLVLNNSGWINVVDIRYFNKKDKIEGFVSPRYFFPISKEKAYVTDLYSGYIYIIDLNQNNISNKIFTGRWTEKMTFLDKKLYISCPWFYTKPASKTILVVDTENDIITDSIMAGISPGDIGFDKNNILWVLNNGNNLKSIHGSIYKIDTETKTVLDSFVFENTLKIFGSSMKFSAEKDSIFVLYNEVYVFSTEGNIFPKKIISRNNRNLYGMNLDNESHNIFVTDAMNFAEKGKVYIYSKQGVLLKTIIAGYIPNDVKMY